MAASKHTEWRNHIGYVVIDESTSTEEKQPRGHATTEEHGEPLDGVRSCSIAIPPNLHFLVLRGLRQAGLRQAGRPKTSNGDPESENAMKWRKIMTMKAGHGPN